MRLATLRTEDGTLAARVDGDEAVELGLPDVGAVLARPDWREWARTARGARRRLKEARYAPLIPRPGKIICVGLNYRTHIKEMGRELPRHPTLFAKYPEALIGAGDDIQIPAASDAMDWEAELAVVVGDRVRSADPRRAAAAIAGYSLINDVTARDWQYRSPQWLQGKTFEGSTPFGPVLVTADELEGELERGLELVAELDGTVVQRADTSDLLFDPAALVGYVSQILTLNPGDVIATGTPGGVGHARKPPSYLEDGAVLVTRIDSIGRLVNTARKSS
ncbi:fumarylacetoacetate hydrolase family protein [Actinomadura sp. NPDC049753]|uniref:fumarylacetoacetate hydrolase family protein n=1 Tax=Actinomadura sp. NPDC049753 TaxID=3154739 RepID=UPI00343E686B